ncbi:MAG: nicotinate phosphoribosyltransferase [Saprospiraceae bacterium]|nr:nicotinate phosphoribosyltransferase [Saprospiraceae bacterium]
MSSSSFINYSASYTDLYQLTMAQVYFEQGRKDTPVVFDYFFRKLPFKGGYVLTAGLGALLDILEDFYFTTDDLAYLKEIGFQRNFLNFLKDYKFKGNIRAFPEGDLVFANCPVLTVEGNLIDGQITETIILNVLNFQSLVATKASRMRQVAKDKILIDFGLRRAQGPASYYASRAAVVGGFNATSHVKAALDFDIDPSGTMAHSFIQSMPDELSAFRAYAESQKDKCVLLVDTYDTLHSGVPNAIKVGQELAEKGHRLLGIRLDSGDLSYLAKESRKLLDQAGLNYVKIAASNQLDEFVIKSLEEQHAPIDIYGIGTSLVTGRPDGALDGVYKMSEINNNPTIKLSENIVKITLPGNKSVYRLFDKNGEYAGSDLVALRDEDVLKQMHHPSDPYKSMRIEELKKEPVLGEVMIGGKKVKANPTISEINAFSQKQLKKLPDEFKRFENPHIYKVGISHGLQTLRNRLIQKHTL